MSRLGRMAVLWGGGMGDLLVIRPLLQAMEKCCTEPPFLMTRTGRLLAMLDAFGLNTEVLQLDDSPWRALRQVRRTGRFDCVYVGPHASRNTRLLAHAVKAGRIWAKAGDDPDRFIADVICDDVVRLGLAASPPAPYGGAPLLGVKQGATETTDTIILHTGTKPKWETTRWSVENWRTLVSRLLEHTEYRLVVVGAESEAGEVSNLLRGVDVPDGRISVDLGRPFPELERLIGSARGVICHNSGIMHMATALEKPTVVITGSSARFWRPPYPWVTNVTSGACELACNRYRCPVPGYRAKCIRELEVDQVWQAVTSMFG